LQSDPHRPWPVKQRIMSADMATFPMLPAAGVLEQIVALEKLTVSCSAISPAIATPRNWPPARFARHWSEMAAPIWKLLRAAKTPSAHDFTSAKPHATISSPR